MAGASNQPYSHTFVLYACVMTHVIAVIQTKGGAGKTTVSMMLAFALAELGDSVVVLDADKQQSATDWAKAVGDVEGAITVCTVPTERTLEDAVEWQDGKWDFLIIDTPPGSNSIVRTASGLADLVLVPTGVSPLDMRRTQATLDYFDGTDVPVAVVLNNVDKRENLLEDVLATLTANTRAAVADTIVHTRTATRKAGETVPRIHTKPFREWIELAKELKQAF
jgi:chromosome partitioning protein